MSTIMIFIVFSVIIYLAVGLCINTVLIKKGDLVFEEVGFYWYVLLLWLPIILIYATYKLFSMIFYFPKKIAQFHIKKYKK